MGAVVSGGAQPDATGAEELFGALLGRAAVLFQVLPSGELQALDLLEVEEGVEPAQRARTEAPPVFRLGPVPGGAGFLRGSSELLGLGKLPIQQPGAPLAGEDAAAGVLDLFPGAPAGVGVAALDGPAEKIKAVDSGMDLTGTEMMGPYPMTGWAGPLPRGLVVVELADDPLGELLVVVRWLTVLGWFVALGAPPPKHAGHNSQGSWVAAMTR